MYKNYYYKNHIGVYEIEFYNKCHKDVNDIINKHGEIYLEKLGEPLLFVFLVDLLQKDHFDLNV